MPPSNDLLLLDVSEDGNGFAGLTLPSPGFTVSGIQKLVQTYVTLLFTEKGSVKSNRTFGTSFFTLLRAKNIGQTGQVDTAFQTANREITAWYNTYVDASVPDDEFFESSRLLNFSVPQADTIILTIQITSRAGNSYVYRAPQTLIQV